MSLPANIKVNVYLPFPASVQGVGGLSVVKNAGGIWIISPAFDQLAAIVNLPLPASKQVWVFDPVTKIYNVLTLAAVGASLFLGTSTTSVQIALGPLAFATQPGKLFPVGSFVTAASNGTPADFVAGNVIGYDAVGNLIVNVTTASGIGNTHADWNIASAGAVGATGATGASYKATSVTSFAISNSALRVFATQPGLAYLVGARLRATSNGSPTNWNEGIVTAYNPVTGSISVQMDKSAGAGTFADWNFNIAGQPGAGDLLSTNNLSDLANAAAARTNLGIIAANVPYTPGGDYLDGNFTDVQTAIKRLGQADYMIQLRAIYSAVYAMGVQQQHSL